MMNCNHLGVVSSFKPYHANTYHFVNAFGTLPKSNEMILFPAGVLGFWRNMFNIVL